MIFVFRIDMPAWAYLLAQRWIFWSAMNCKNMLEGLKSSPDHTRNTVSLLICVQSRLCDMTGWFSSGRGIVSSLIRCELPRVALGWWNHCNEIQRSYILTPYSYGELTLVQCARLCWWSEHENDESEVISRYDTGDRAPTTNADHILAAVDSYTARSSNRCLSTHH